MLVTALLSELPAYPTLRVVAVCVPRRTFYWRQLLRHATNRVVGWIKRCLIGDSRYLHRDPAPTSLGLLARRHGFEVRVARDANSAEVIRLCGELHADVLLSLFWKRKFGPEVLALFRQAVNYHNGSVPNYRGLRATRWSIYRGESHSGFTFHRINERLDLGNVIVDGAVPIEPNASVLDVEMAKTVLAASRLPAVLDAIATNRPGMPQSEPTKYNRVADIARLTCIESPAAVGSLELLRRIRAFGPVQVRIGHELMWMSGLGAAARGGRSSRLPTLELEDGLWHVKRSDWRAHRLNRITRRRHSRRSSAGRS